MGTTEDLAGRYCLTLDLDVESASYLCTALDLAERIPGRTKRDHEAVMRYGATISRVQRLLREAISESMRNEAEGGGHD
jgi:hypothetical protein